MAPNETGVFVRSSLAHNVATPSPGTQPKKAKALYVVLVLHKQKSLGLRDQ